MPLRATNIRFCHWYQGILNAKNASQVQTDISLRFSDRFKFSRIHMPPIVWIRHLVERVCLESPEAGQFTNIHVFTYRTNKYPVSVAVISSKSITPTRLSQIDISTCLTRFCDHCPHNYFLIYMLIIPLHLQFHYHTPLN